MIHILLAGDFWGKWRLQWIRERVKKWRRRVQKRQRAERLPWEFGSGSVSLATKCITVVFPRGSFKAGRQERKKECWTEWPHKRLMQLYIHNTGVTFQGDAVTGQRHVNLWIISVCILLRAVTDSETLLLLTSAFTPWFSWMEKVSACIIKLTLLWQTLPVLHHHVIGCSDQKLGFFIPL